MLIQGAQLFEQMNTLPRSLLNEHLVEHLVDSKGI